MALGDYNPDYKPNLKSRREEINNTSYEVLDKLHSRSDFSRWCKNCTYFLEEVRQLLLELTSLNSKGRREMSEPVLYINTFGVVVNSLEASPPQEELLRQRLRRLALACESGQQLLEQDDEISKLKGYIKRWLEYEATQEIESKRLKGIVTDQEDVIDDLKKQFLFSSHTQHLKEQEKAIKCLKQRAIEQQALIVERNNIIVKLQKERQCSHPGKVIDAQEKIITKLQSEIKKLEQRNHQWLERYC